MPVSLRPIDHLRAALIAVHIVAVMLMAIPSPEGFGKAGALEDKRIAGAVQAWEQALARVFIPPEVTRGVILQGGWVLEAVEDRSEQAFAPYVALSGAKQRWKMFSSSPARGSRVEMWVEEAGEWRLVYTPVHPGHRWRAGLWEAGRVRGVMNALAHDQFVSTWRAFAHSAARRASVDFPGATRFKIQRIPVRIPGPATLRATGRLEEGEPEDVVVLALPEAR